MRLLKCSFILSLVVLLFCACGETSDNDGSESDGDAETGESSDGDGENAADGDSENAEALESDGDVEAEDALPPPVTTVTRRLEPTQGFGELCTSSQDQLKIDYCKNPATYERDFSIYFDKGMGFLEEGPGEPFTVREDLGISKGSYGTRTRLAGFVQFTDVHITDEESTLRTASFDSSAIPSALRPQDMYTENVFRDAVDTVRRYNVNGNLDFALITGDSTDTAEKYEMETGLAILVGGEINPDTGEDNDLIEGPGNDPQDPLTSPGIGIPFYYALGNHDQLIMGNWEINEDARAQGSGSDPESGTRDGQTMLVTNDEVPADENRLPLLHTEMINTIMNAGGEPAGHGYSQTNIDENDGYYAFDAPNGAPIRIIVLDTSFRPQGFAGDNLTFVNAVIDRVQFEHFLKPELEDAYAAHKLVIVSSHEQSDHLQNDGFDDGRFITEEELTGTLLSYDNVILHAVGHGHKHQVRVHKNPDANGGYFEVETTSLIDFPQQFRFWEIVANGNGTVSIYTAVVDHQGAEGSMSEYARRLTLVDQQTGWDEVGLWGETADRNMELVVQIPEGWDAYLSEFEGGAIEALELW